VVKDEVLARHHRALLIMGGGHFQRRNGPGYVESQLRAAGADPYVILFGTNAAGGYDQLDPRFDSWHTPAVIALAGNWVGQLPAGPVLTGGMAPASPLKLADAADALLYLGQRDALVQVNMPRAELDGTAYGEEIARRLAIQRGRAVDFLPAQDEVPQFQRPQPRPQGATPPSMPSMPPMPKSVHDPLPPRPPSQ
jgi:hypothetical protein